MKFIPLPIPVRAVIWTGGPDMADDYLELDLAVANKRIRFEKSGTSDCVLLIKDRDRTQRCRQGDWIVIHNDGRLEALCPQDFAARYTYAKHLEPDGR